MQGKAATALGLHDATAIHYYEVGGGPHGLCIKPFLPVGGMRAARKAAAAVASHSDNATRRARPRL